MASPLRASLGTEANAAADVLSGPSSASAAAAARSKQPASASTHPLSAARSGAKGLRLSAPAAKAAASPSGTGNAAPAARAHATAAPAGGTSGAAAKSVQVAAPAAAAAEAVFQAQPASSASQDGSMGASTSSADTGFASARPAWVAGRARSAGPGSSSEDSDESDEEEPVHEGLNAWTARQAQPVTPVEVPPMKPVAASMLHPDPRTRPVLMHLGTLQLPFKVKAPYNIPELQRRLLPFGAYVPFHGVTDWEHIRALATRLHLDSRYSFLEFLPLPVPFVSDAGLPARVFPVTVISSDGRAKPITFGLIIEEDMAWKDAAKAARKHPLAACNTEEEIVFLACHPRASPCNASLNHVTDGKKMHRKPSDAECMKGYVVMRIPKTARAGNKPIRVLINNQTGEYDEDGVGDEIAFDVLLPLSSEEVQGGHAACDAIGQQLLEALKPYRKEGAPDREPQECFTLLRCQSQGYPQRQGDYWREGDKNANFTTRRNRPMNLEGEQLVHIIARWSAVGLALFHTDAWDTPEVHPSAAADILAGTKQRLKLEILPAASEGEGTFQIEIFISRRKEPQRRGSTCFGTILNTVHKEYPAKVPATQKRSKAKAQPTGYPLENTMELLTRKNPDARAMYKDMKEWKDRQKGVKLGVTTLMKMLQAGERPAAPQPAELTVQLHPYQQQALQFMLDNECLGRGSQSHFWVPCETTSGE
ncbi:g5381 [Coccomyxa viridis]|uniref:G5381 protein n=1 Tax=Coccomyxa viridis TaxID=1274662 RepID=A0ABP1FUY7_9CHLO